MSFKRGLITKERSYEAAVCGLYETYSNLRGTKAVPRRTFLEIKYHITELQYHNKNVSKQSTVV